MNRQIALALGGLAISMSGLAWAAEPGIHNDFDGDGRSDVLWRSSSTGAIVYWSAGNSAHATIVKVSYFAYNVAPGFDLSHTTPVVTHGNDWDMPVRSVIVVRDAANHDFDLFHDDRGGYGAYALWEGNADWKVAGAGDFNGDDTSDLLYRNQRDGRNALLSDASWADWAGYSSLASVTDLAWTVAGTGDFDGDRSTDVLWRNSVTGKNVIWRSANIATRIQVAPVTNFAWKIDAIADFNGDGKSDIFWRNRSTGANQVWFSANAATRPSVATVVNQQWRVTATGDFDGDGKSDLFWRNSNNGANTIWRSANATTQIPVSPVSNLAWSTVK